MQILAYHNRYHFKNFVERNYNHVDKLVRLCTGKIDIWKQDSQEPSKEPVIVMRKFSYTDKPIVFETLPLIVEDNELETE